jgi:hypothetical protein
MAMLKKFIDENGAIFRFSVLCPYSHFCPQHADWVIELVEHDGLRAAAWDECVLREFARYGVHRSDADFDL